MFPLLPSIYCIFELVGLQLWFSLVATSCSIVHATLSIKLSLMDLSALWITVSAMAFLRLALMSFFLACVAWSTTPLLALMVFMLCFAVYYCYVGLLCWNSCCWSGFDASTCSLSCIAGLFALLLLLEWLLLLLSTACASCIADLYAAHLWTVSCC